MYILLPVCPSNEAAVAVMIVSYHYISEMAFFDVIVLIFILKRWRSNELH